jgi:hypothetical protein
VGVNKAVRYKNITLTPGSRTINITNEDANDKVWVDVHSATNTSETEKCFLLGPGNSLDLYDYSTDGLSFIYDSTYSTGNEASPISVMVTY